MKTITKPYRQPLPYDIGSIHIQETEDSIIMRSHNFETTLTFLDAVNLRNHITRWSDNKRLREEKRVKSKNKEIAKNG